MTPSVSGPPDRRDVRLYDSRPVLRDNQKTNPLHQFTM